ncbi:MAG TPA: hypothetical protein VGV90_17505 [Solirubrobacteraceae bacterium]|nr:hypothetical protein [Solirubrobacteraceae bacterium]
MKINRIIRKQLRDADGSVIGDVNAAIAANVGEPGGSETHVTSHSRIVQSSRSGQVHTTSESSTRPDPPAEADDPKEAT